MNDDIGHLPRPAMAVRATDPPSMWVEIGTERLPIAPGDPSYPRVDLVCLRLDDLGEVHAAVVRGTPEIPPRPPKCPEGHVPFASVNVPAFAHIVGAWSIGGVPA